MKKPIEPNILNAVKNIKNPNELLNTLSQEEKATVNKMLSDKKALNELLNSQEAASIIKMLSGKD